MVDFLAVHQRDGSEGTGILTANAHYKEMGLNEGEYQKILDTLKREPTITELGMYAVLGSYRPLKRRSSGRSVAVSR